MPAMPGSGPGQGRAPAPPHPPRGGRGSAPPDAPVAAGTGGAEAGSGLAHMPR